MIYIDSFKFAKPEAEEDFLFAQRRKCFDTYYPFNVFPGKGFERIDFSDITILYGGNGSGKSTALNLIADLIEADRDTVYNRSNFFGEYLELCSIRYEDESFINKAIITSDGVFDRMLDIRHVNQAIDVDRERAFNDYVHWKTIKKYPEKYSRDELDAFEEIRRNPLQNFDKFKETNMALHKTQSQYARKTVADNIREKSNGESAFAYFADKIEGDGIYILDEPENSLAPNLQMELVKLIEDGVRYFNCQFVIATHSPFILAINGAKIYDLDEYPVDLKRWTELDNVRAYYRLIKEHEEEFD